MISVDLLRDDFAIDVVDATPFHQRFHQNRMERSGVDGFWREIRTVEMMTVGQCCW
jgi:hypothetical protein